MRVRIDRFRDHAWDARQCVVKAINELEGNPELEEQRLILCTVYREITEVLRIVNEAYLREGPKKNT